jgi:uncharacterized membrane protein YgdD (TMEM256/DUF423 family)
VLGFLGVALGAFGAHAIKPHLIATGTESMWEKAVIYQFVHTLALLALSARPRVPACPAWLFTAGIILFSGSLYVFAAWRISAAVYFTPVGGVCFLAGWICLAVSKAE